MLYKHIIQVEYKNVGLKVWGVWAQTYYCPAIKKVGGGGTCPSPPPASYASVCMCIYIFIYIYIYNISILLICLCSFDLFCPLLEKDSFIENLYIAMSCPFKM